MGKIPDVRVDNLDEVTRNTPIPFRPLIYEPITSIYEKLCWNPSKVMKLQRLLNEIP